MDVFVDHGPNHVVHDFDGDKPMQKLITDISNINGQECLIRYETPEGQQAVSISKGFYEISEVNGISSLNSAVLPIARDYSDPVKTIRIPFSISSNEVYLGGGMLNEKKLPSPYPMNSLKEKLYSPGNTFADPPTLVLTDLLNFGSELQQHVAFYATMLFFSECNRLPSFQIIEDVEKVVLLAKQVVNEKKIDVEEFELDEAFVRRYVRKRSC
jgi:hypothetical protein